MRVKETIYGGTKTILYNVDGFEAMPVTVSDDGVAADAKGNKVVKAGTLIGAGGDGTLKDPALHVKANNNADCEGILLEDVDVTDGPAPGAMVYKGNINLDKIPEEPSAAARTAVPMLRFLR